MLQKKSWIREYGEALLWALVLALIIRTFIVQAYKIPSGSMLQTLQIGDHLLVNKFAYGVKVPFTHRYLLEGANPQIGDIIVFEYPKDPSLDYIKRVIGLPGDVIEVRNKQLYRNGEKITEPYIQHLYPFNAMARADTYGPTEVPAGQYFVMGDNRDDSQDSRFWGFVEKSAIQGKAWRIYMSWDGEKNTIRWNRLGKSLE